MRYYVDARLIGVGFILISFDRFPFLKCLDTFDCFDLIWCFLVLCYSTAQYEYTYSLLFSFINIIYVCIELYYLLKHTTSILYIIYFIYGFICIRTLCNYFQNIYSSIYLIMWAIIYLSNLFIYLHNLILYHLTCLFVCFVYLCLNYLDTTTNLINQPINYFVYVLMSFIIVVNLVRAFILLPRYNIRPLDMTQISLY